MLQNTNDKMMLFASCLAQNVKIYTSFEYVRFVHCSMPVHVCVCAYFNLPFLGLSHNFPSPLSFASPSLSLFQSIVFRLMLTEIVQVMRDPNQKVNSTVGVPIWKMSLLQCIIQWCTYKQATDRTLHTHKMTSAPISVCRIFVMCIKHNVKWNECVRVH